MTRDELIAALEAASGPDRILDFQIERLLQGKPLVEHDVWWFNHNRVAWKNGDEDDVTDWPRYTASIDAALSLVKPGDGVDTFFIECDCGAWFVRFRSHVDELNTRNVAGVEHSALEFCRQYFLHQAAIRARGTGEG